jgi:hypothetical protein
MIIEKGFVLLQSRNSEDTAARKKERDNEEEEGVE